MSAKKFIAKSECPLCAKGDVPKPQLVIKDIRIGKKYFVSSPALVKRLIEFVDKG